MEFVGVCEVDKALIRYVARLLLGVARVAVLNSVARVLFWSIHYKKHLNVLILVNISGGKKHENKN